MTEPTISIEHQPDRHRFVGIMVRAEDQAMLTYQLLGTDRINFDYSYVPPSFTGQGVAKRLVDVGFAWAQSEGRQIQASCSYVAQFVR